MQYGRGLIGVTVVDKGNRHVPLVLGNKSSSGSRRSDAHHRFQASKQGGRESPKGENPVGLSD